MKKPTTTVARSVTLAVAAIVMGASLVACGSSGDSNNSSGTSTLPDAAPVASEPTVTTALSEATVTTMPSDTVDEASEESLELAVRRYTTAFLGGDASTSRALLSQRCQDSLSVSQWRLVVTQAKILYGNATITEYHETVDGQRGLATYTLSDPILNQTDEPWIIESGSWRNDEC